MRTPQYHGPIVAVLRQYHPTDFTFDRAEVLAEQLTAEDEDGWTYEVEMAAMFSKRARVVVYDDRGCKMGYL